MQNLIQKFRQGSIVFEKLVFCLKIWELWRAPTTLQFIIFCWNFARVSCLTMPTTECVGFFLFCLDLELFAKIKNDLVSTHSRFTLLLITQDVNKIKKIPHTILYALPNRKRVQNFSKKILNSMVVGACRSFHFLRQKTWFLGNDRGLP